MNIQEAYKILDLKEGATKEDINKAFRQLSKKYHPDMATGDEAKFKEINEAKQILENPEKHNSHSGGYGNMDDIMEQMRRSGFGGFGRQAQPEIITPKINENNPLVELNISFIESVLGTKKSISYERYKKCEECGGRGAHVKQETCGACNGVGRHIHVQGMMQMITDCQKCNGTGKSIKDSKPCKKCNKVGGIKETITSEIKVPAGVETGNILRVQGAGHFSYSVPGQGDAYGEVYIPIIVEKDPNMSLDGKNVVSKVEISLLDALIGCNRKISTVKGEISLNIPSKIKNNDQRKLGGYGVDGRGDHIITIQVNYPDNVDELVKWLDENKS